MSGFVPEGSEWSPEDDLWLADAIRAGLTQPAIAVHLGRTKASVAKREAHLRRNLGMAIPARQVEWTAEDDAKLLRLIAEGKGRKAIGKILGRSEHAVTSRLKRIVPHEDFDLKRTIAAGLPTSSDEAYIAACRDAGGFRSLNLSWKAPVSRPAYA